MVFLWTSLWTSYLRFMLIGNYNGFVVDMDSLGQANLHFSEELQCFRGGHGFCETVRSESNRPRVLREQKMLPEGRNGPLLLWDFFQLFNLWKNVTNPMGDPSVLPIQSPIYLYHQAEVWEDVAIGGWCVVSCTSIQISKFTVQA